MSRRSGVRRGLWASATRSLGPSRKIGLHETGVSTGRVVQAGSRFGNVNVRLVGREFERWLVSNL